MKVRFWDFVRNQKGATIIEYALMASLISIVMIAALKKVGNGYISIYNSIGESIEKEERVPTSEN